MFADRNMDELRSGYLTQLVKRKQRTFKSEDYENNKILLQIYLL